MLTKPNGPCNSLKAGAMMRMVPLEDGGDMDSQCRMGITDLERLRISEKLDLMSL